MRYDVKLKQSYLVFLADGSPEAADRYRQTKQIAATLVTETKTRDWKELGKAMENDFWTSSKKVLDHHPASEGREAVRYEHFV